jgi:hypothetical protein
MKYKYTLLKQDGSTEDLGVSKEKDFAELYKILNCRTIEIINSDYYEGRATMYGDEEGRFNEKNHRNPHFKVLKNEAMFGDQEWDVVGDIVKQEVYHE